MTAEKISHIITYYSLKDLGKNTLTHEECTGNHPRCLQHGDREDSVYPRVGKIPE